MEGNFVFRARLSTGVRVFSLSQRVHTASQAAPAKYEYGGLFPPG
jgi:hypothetical protein